MKKLLLFFCTVIFFFSCQHGEEETNRQMGMKGGYRLVNSHLTITNNLKISSDVEWNIKAINFIGNDNELYGISGTGSSFSNSGIFSSLYPSNTVYTNECLTDYLLPLLADKTNKIDIVFGLLSETTGKNCLFEISAEVKGDNGIVLKQEKVTTGAISGDYTISLDIAEYTDQLNYDINISVIVLPSPSDSKTITFNGDLKIINSGKSGLFMPYIADMQFNTVAGTTTVTSKNIEFTGYDLPSKTLDYTETTSYNFLNNYDLITEYPLVSINFPLQLIDLDQQYYYDVEVRLLGNNGTVLTTQNYTSDPEDNWFDENIYLDMTTVDELSNYTIDIIATSYIKEGAHKSLICDGILKNEKTNSSYLEVNFDVDYIEFKKDNQLLTTVNGLLAYKDWNYYARLDYGQTLLRKGTEEYRLDFSNECNTIVVYFDGSYDGSQIRVLVRIYNKSNTLIGSDFIERPGNYTPYFLPIPLNTRITEFEDLRFEITATAI